jgi:hypothetical protein
MKSHRKSHCRSLPVVLVLGIFTLVPNAFAVKFANQFTEFELPPGWTCNLEVAEWVCQSADPVKKKEAIIVLAAKLKGDQDSLDQYLTYLKATKTFTSVSGKSMKSEPKYAKTVNVNGHPWVDALHLESEIPGFFTRYFATIQEDIGVLVTYSVAKSKYQDYLKDFDNMVNTLKVFRKSGGINVGPKSEGLPKIEIPTSVTADGGVFPGGNGGVNPQGGNEGPAKRPAEKSNDLMLYGIIGAAAAAFFIIKKKKR